MMKVELKHLLDELGIKNPEEILSNKLNLIWQNKYREVQKSDISLEEKTERLIKINDAKDKLESYDMDIIRSLVKKKSKRVSESKESKTKKENYQKQSKFKKYYPKNEVSKYLCKKCNGKGFLDKGNKDSFLEQCEECLGTGLIKEIKNNDPINLKEVQLVYRGVSYSKTWNKTLKKFGKFKRFLMKLVS